MRKFGIQADIVCINMQQRHEINAFTKKGDKFQMKTKYELDGYRKTDTFVELAKNLKIYPILKL